MVKSSNNIIYNHNDKKKSIQKIIKFFTTHKLEKPLDHKRNHANKAKYYFLKIFTQFDTYNNSVFENIRLFEYVIDDAILRPTVESSCFLFKKTLRL